MILRRLFDDIRDEENNVLSLKDIGMLFIGVYILVDNYSLVDNIKGIRIMVVL